MPENGTYRLSGGRRRALWWAPPPTRHRRSGGIEPTRPRGGKGAPAGGTGGGKDGQHTAVGSRLHVTTTDSRTGQISLGDGGGHRLASWTSGYATARSEAICRGVGCGRTRTSGSVGGQGQQRPWSTRPDAEPGSRGLARRDLCLTPRTEPARRWRRSLPAHHQLDNARGLPRTRGDRPYSSSSGSGGVIGFPAPANHVLEACRDGFDQACAFPPVASGGSDVVPGFWRARRLRTDRVSFSICSCRRCLAVATSR